MRQSIPLAVLFLVAELGLAGCGDGNESPSVDLDKAPGCYAEAKRPADPMATRGVIAGRPSPNPAAECARFWVNGGIAKRREAPPLVVCVGDNRTPWVFPGDDDTCAELGLSRA